jgi:hypothetical protein
MSTSSDIETLDKLIQLGKKSLSEQTFINVEYFLETVKQEIILDVSNESINVDTIITFSLFVYIIVFIVYIIFRLNK